MKKILVLGASGQLAHDLMPLLLNYSNNIFPVSRIDVDLDHSNAIETIKLKYPAPEIIINCAAATNTTLCEERPAQAFRVNCEFVYDLAKYARQISATIIHISTDYVFSGQQTRPYDEDDNTNPVNMYGVTKLAGEHALRFTCPLHYILRTSSLYGVAGAGAKGGNFVEAMISRAHKNEIIKVVADQYMSPTHTEDLAKLILHILHNPSVPYGVYHFSNAGACSWHQFAMEIFNLLKLSPQVEAVSASSFPSKLKRPVNSVLDHSKILKIYKLQNWQEALKSYLIKKGHLK